MVWLLCCQTLYQPRIIMLFPERNYHTKSYPGLIRKLGGNGIAESAVERHGQDYIGVHLM